MAEVLSDIAAVCSEAGAPPVLEADEGYLIGPSPVGQSFLNMGRIVATAAWCAQ
jgi:acetyl/propionyl-CoA carboxylase alpha subunit